MPICPSPMPPSVSTGTNFYVEPSREDSPQPADITFIDLSPVQNTPPEPSSSQESPVRRSSPPDFTQPTLEKSLLLSSSSEPFVKNRVNLPSSDGVCNELTTERRFPSPTNGTDNLPLQHLTVVKARVSKHPRAFRGRLFPSDTVSSDKLKVRRFGKNTPSREYQVIYLTSGMPVTSAEKLNILAPFIQRDTRTNKFFCTLKNCNSCQRSAKVFSSSRKDNVRQHLSPNLFVYRCCKCNSKLKHLSSLKRHFKLNICN